MTPRQRVEAVLRGERPDRPPFTVYESKIPPEPFASQLARRGMCTVQRRVNVYDGHHPNCPMTVSEVVVDGRRLRRRDIRTPAGPLHSLEEPAGFTTWTRRHLFGGPEDYAAMGAYLADMTLEATYAEPARLEREAPPHVIHRASIGGEPLQTLISCMGTETFCVEWMENRDEVLKLYAIVAEKRRLAYRLVASGPLGHANYGGNVTPEIIGPSIFREYYVPHYQEAAEVLHAGGKKIGVHFDANCRLFSDDIARLDLDYIEAFTPAPDTDMTLAEARAAWPDKTLWINFPSSVHLQPEPAVEEAALNLLGEAGAKDGRFIMGITEDLPAGREAGNFAAILNAIDRYAG